MNLQLNRGVPLELVIQFLQEHGLTCVIEGDTLRVRWSPRVIVTDDSGLSFATQFLKYAASGTED